MATHEGRTWGLGLGQNPMSRAGQVRRVRKASKNTREDLRRKMAKGGHSYKGPGQQNLEGGTENAKSLPRGHAGSFSGPHTLLEAQGSKSETQSPLVATM